MSSAVEDEAEQDEAISHLGGSIGHARSLSSHILLSNGLSSTSDVDPRRQVLPKSIRTGCSVASPESVEACEIMTLLRRHKDGVISQGGTLQGASTPDAIPTKKNRLQTDIIGEEPASSSTAAAGSAVGSRRLPRGVQGSSGRGESGADSQEGAGPELEQRKEGHRDDGLEENDEDEEEERKVDDTESKESDGEGEKSQTKAETEGKPPPLPRRTQPTFESFSSPSSGAPAPASSSSPSGASTATPVRKQPTFSLFSSSSSPFSSAAVNVAGPSWLAGKTTSSSTGIKRVHLAKSPSAVSSTSSRSDRQTSASADAVANGTAEQRDENSKRVAEKEPRSFDDVLREGGGAANDKSTTTSKLSTQLAGRSRLTEEGSTGQVSACCRQEGAVPAAPLSKINGKGKRKADESDDDSQDEPVAKEPKKLARTSAKSGLKEERASIFDEDEEEADEEEEEDEDEDDEFEGLDAADLDGSDEEDDSDDEMEYSDVDEDAQGGSERDSEEDIAGEIDDGEGAEQLDTDEEMAALGLPKKGTKLSNKQRKKALAEAERCRRFRGALQEGGADEQDDDEEDDDEEEGEGEGEDEDDEGMKDDFILPTLEDRLREKEQGADLQVVQMRIHEVVAVLNNFKKLATDGRSRSEYVDQLLDDVCNYYGYNRFLAERFFNMFTPSEAIELFEANETPRPVTIRTNTLRTRRRDLAQALINRGVNLEPIAGKWTKVGLQVFESTVPIGATPEYLAGHYILQAASSFLPCIALAPQPNERVLDMASAPGASRPTCEQVREDLQLLTHLQKQLLLCAIDSVNPKSATGGYVVYSTCSILVDEDEAVVDYALKKRPNVKIVDSGVQVGRDGFTAYRERRFDARMNLAKRVYPHTHNMDGFFFCKLKVEPHKSTKTRRARREKAGQKLRTLRMDLRPTRLRRKKGKDASASVFDDDEDAMLVEKTKQRQEKVKQRRRSSQKMEPSPADDDEDE
ncbi:hypothetical protein L7F22_067134 [Adiantum nelumboides]|nr:hypothetical protein [Adiantum nelumboides]